MKALRLHVIRNGGTRWTAERRFTGWRDVPLSPEGQGRAEAVGRALSAATVAAVYASPLERARTTAETIARTRRVAVTIEPAFREMGFGTWEALAPEEVAARFPEGWAAWRDEPHRVAFDGGERLTDVAARVAGGIARLQDKHGGETVVLVTHAIVIRLIVLAALGLPPERLWSVDASLAGLTELEYAADWVTVHRMNTVAHLDGIEAGDGSPGAGRAPGGLGAIPGGARAIPSGPPVE